MPRFFGKEKKKEKLINSLGELYSKIEQQHSISKGDFPPISNFREKLRGYDFSKLPKLKQKLVDDVDKMLQIDVTKLMSMIPKENDSATSVTVRGGVFTVDDSSYNPFATGAGKGIQYGAGSDDWVIMPRKAEYDSIFETLKPDLNGKVSGSEVMRELYRSKLQSTVLGQIWKLASIDGDGMLDSDEFAVASYLVELKLNGYILPQVLPFHLVPPSKRKHMIHE